MRLGQALLAAGGSRRGRQRPGRQRWPLPLNWLVAHCELRHPCIELEMPLQPARSLCAYNNCRHVPPQSSAEP